MKLFFLVVCGFSESVQKHRAVRAGFPPYPVLTELPELRNLATERISDSAEVEY